MFSFNMSKNDISFVDMNRWKPVRIELIRELAWSEP